MQYFRCTVCGYIHEGDEPPEQCPLCGAPRDKFVPCDADGNDLEAAPAPDPAPTASSEPAVGPAAPGDDAAQEGLPLWLQSPPFERAAALVMQFHLHPIAVHTPNGVLPMAFLFLILAMMLGFSQFEPAAFFSLVFVFINMPLVLFTGYVAWQKRYQGAMTSIFRVKIAASLVVTGSLLLLVLMRLINPGVAGPDSGFRWLYLLLMLICLGAAGLAGHFGGKLVFGSRK